MGLVIRMQGEADLPQVVLAMGATRRLSGRPDGRQHQRDQDPDDRDADGDLD